MIIELRRAYDDQVRTALAFRQPDGWACVQDGPLLRCSTPRRGFVNYRDLGGLRGPELDALITRTVEFFAGRGESFEWKTHGHDEPADLPDRLHSLGFVPEERETVVIARTEDIAAEPSLPDGVTLRVVDADHDLRRIAVMESAVWAEDRSWLADDLIARVTATPDDIVVLVAEAGTRVVSAGWLVHNPGTDFAGLWGGSTLAPWRRRGIYRALVARRAQLAAERGVGYLQVDASENSRPILQRLGFTAVTTTTPYIWTPPVV